MTHRECRYSRRWPEIWASLTPEEGRVLSQVLAGQCLTGGEPTRGEALALSEYMTWRIDATEYGRRVGRARSAHRRVGPEPALH